MSTDVVDPGSTPRPGPHRVAVITAAPGAHTHHALLDLGAPPAGAPSCDLCDQPAAILLDAGALCRRCINAAASHALRPAAPRP